MNCATDHKLYSIFALTNSPWRLFLAAVLCGVTQVATATGIFFCRSDPPAQARILATARIDGSPVYLVAGMHQESACTAMSLPLEDSSLLWGRFVDMPEQNDKQSRLILQGNFNEDVMVSEVIRPEKAPMLALSNNTRKINTQLMY